MGRQLNSYVYVEDKDGISRGFGPGDDVPSWAAKQITNPDVWVDEADDEPVERDRPDVLAERFRGFGAKDSMVAAVADLDDDDVEALAALDDDQLRETIEMSRAGGDDPPPKGGAGSGIEEWTAYATAHGIDVPADATRDDIITAVEAAQQ
jgi:hypothetical protein